MDKIGKKHIETAVNKYLKRISNSKHKKTMRERLEHILGKKVISPKKKTAKNLKKTKENNYSNS